jgi:hypothetical protein
VPRGLPSACTTRSSTRAAPTATKGPPPRGWGVHTIVSIVIDGTIGIPAIIIILVIAVVRAAQVHDAHVAATRRLINKDFGFDGRRRGHEGATPAAARAGSNDAATTGC